MYVCTNLTQNLWRGEIFLAFLIFGTMSTMVSIGGFLINVTIIYKDLLKDRDIANFLGGKCTFAPIYLKISAMEGEIFWAFLIFGTISTMLWRRIFDKCANYVERFVISLESANFKVENVHLHQFISKSLRCRVTYFGHF